MMQLEVEYQDACACHLLNLISSATAAEAANDTYKRLSQSLQNDMLCEMKPASQSSLTTKWNMSKQVSVFLTPSVSLELRGP